MIEQLNFTSVLFVYALLLIPLAIFSYLKLKLIQETIFAALRMTVQLTLAGLYLKYIFQLNNPFINLLWLFIMLAIANMSILKKAGLKRRPFFMRSLLSISFSTLLVSAWFILTSIRPDPIYDARYLVPITGMILGNCLRSNVLSLERFYSTIRNKESEYVTYLMLGASLHEATRPYLREAVKAAVNPSISSMATMGVVSLPGMMTGQILSGEMPMVAIQYQIGIMICIFAAMVASALMNILITLPVAFNEYQQLRPCIFNDD